MPHTRVDGRNLYYELHGDTLPGTPLVLIAGLGGSCRGWLPLQVPEFSRERPTLIFDHRGAGESEDSKRAFTTADLARDTAGLLAVLGIERADVLGAFLGGMVAQELALGHAEAVRRLVLVGTYARPDAKRRLLIQQWKDMARAGCSREIMARERLLWSLDDETVEQTDLIEAMLEFFSKDAHPLGDDLFARQCDACLGHDTKERLPGITQTTLVVCGGNDQLTPAKFHRELSADIPDARLITFNLGGHLVMAEWAEKFNHAVQQFLSE